MKRQRLLVCMLTTTVLALLAGSDSPSAFSRVKATPFHYSSHETSRPDDLPSMPPGVSSDWWATVQKNIRQAEYQITWQEKTYLSDVPAAYQAPNRANNLRTYFTPEKSVVIPRLWEKTAATPPWRLEISPPSLGKEKVRKPAASSAAQVAGNRIEYTGRDLVTWYRNDEAGLTQGFTINPIGKSKDKNSMASSPSLLLEMAVTGNLTPRSTLNERVIEFLGRDDKPVLRYGGLSAEDATGRKLPGRIALAGSKVALTIDSTAAAYPIQVRTDYQRPP